MFRSSYNFFSKTFFDLIVNNWLFLLRTIMLMTPFRWTGKPEMVSKISGSGVREHQLEKKFLVFPASKVTRFLFSCDLSLQTSICGISSLGGIVCCCCWKEGFAVSIPDCNSGHLSCHSLKRLLVVFLTLPCRSSFEVFLIISSCDLLRHPLQSV